MGNEEFGVCLKALLAARRDTCSATCLSEALGYADPSTLYSWTRGETVPALRTQYVARIIEHLRLSHVEAQELQNAHVHSLRHPTPRPLRRKRVRTAAPVAVLTNTMCQPPRIRVNSEPQHAFQTRADHAHYPQVAGVLAEMIDLLEGLPDATGLAEIDRTIILTWQSRDMVELPNELQSRWLPTMESVLRRGWRILYLCRVDENVDRTVRLVKVMQTLLGTGNYFPRYFASYGVLAPPYDLLIIPGYAAAVMFATHTMNAVDAGVIIQPGAHAQMLLEHAHQLASQTTPLVAAHFMPDTDTLAAETLTEAESRTGGRYLVKDGLSTITQPEEWFHGRVMPRIPGALPSEDWQATVEHHKRRIAAFKRYVERYDYYDICTMRAIESLVSHGVYADDDPTLRIQHSKTVCLEHLRNVARLLNTYPRYHLALVSERQANVPGPNGVTTGTMWEVTGDDSVFIGTRIPDKTARLVQANLHITEPTVAQGFRVHFRQLWKEIPSIYREKEAVIRFLEGKIAELERDSEASLARTPR